MTLLSRPRLALSTWLVAGATLVTGREMPGVGLPFTLKTIVPDRLPAFRVCGVRVALTLMESLKWGTVSGFTGVAATVTDTGIAMTLTVKEPVATLPCLSVAEQVTVVIPNPSMLPEAGVQLI